MRPREATNCSTLVSVLANRRADAAHALRAPKYIPQQSLGRPATLAERIPTPATVDRIGKICDRATPEIYRSQRSRTSAVATRATDSSFHKHHFIGRWGERIRAGWQRLGQGYYGFAGVSGTPSSWCNGAGTSVLNRHRTVMGFSPDHDSKSRRPQ